MPEATLFVDGITVEEWPFEVPPGTPHNLVVDEGIAAANDSDYCENTINNKKDVYTVEVGPAEIKFIKSIKWRFRFFGIRITFEPGLRLRLFVGGIQRGVDVEINAVQFPLANGFVMFNNLSISAADWIAGPREVWCVSITGAGKPPPQIEE